MIRIDDTLLEEIGLIALPKQDRDQLLRQIYETLEMRVGMRLAERMTDQQLDEFERFIDTNDEAGALKWLESNFPDYKQVVADELEKLKGEIKKDSSKIVEAMQAQGVQASARPVAAGQPQPAPATLPVSHPEPAPAASLPSSEPAQPTPASPLGFDQPQLLTPVQPVASADPASGGSALQPQADEQPSTQSTQQPISPVTSGDGGIVPPPPNFS